MEYNKSYWIGWLQGFADGEGSVDVYGKGIHLANTAKELLEHCQQGLNFLGIASKLYGPYYHKIKHYKPIYRLHIWRRQAVRDWAKLIGFIDPAKREKLRELIAQLDYRDQCRPKELHVWWGYLKDLKD